MSLTTRQLSVRYDARLALAPTDLALEAGELVALIGPNGAGKSSLLRALAGLVGADGSVHWDGRDLAGVSARTRAQLIAYLPQTPQSFWPIQVRDLVGLGRLPHRRFGRRPSADDESAVDWALQQADVDGLAHRPVTELSGGERTRVQLARALAVKAPALLVDEPAASLDPEHQLKLMSVLRNYAQGGACVVAVMHDLVLASRFCSRMLLMHAGRLVADDAPAAVLTPADVKRFYRVHPFITRHDEQTIVVPWEAVD